jgi:hypothetical protein
MSAELQNCVDPKNLSSGCCSNYRVAVSLMTVLIGSVQYLITAESSTVVAHIINARLYI